MNIAVLAVQGAFIEHENIIKKLGHNVIELRQKKDLDNDFDGLILPGGESTVQGKLLKDLDMFDILKEKIENGLPVFATCAGLILLSESLSNDNKKHFATLPVTVKRNAYGRQLGSFHTVEKFGDIKDFPMEFIRAPYIEKVNNDDVEILSKVNDNIVGVKYKNQIGISFHPELTQDTRIHELFLELTKKE
ncbi:pyridoxal 5'-phosphate synthase glutaminase subunit PdxT [Clostridium sp. HCP1S3_B4]|uniref:pyridoxal 5'-phosphate synthase glutaminase subunit PdxT n=1 Tax=unclassified Clostridium TaxID=2614128 RepID=UPI0016B8CED9|nr:pyridoxal 5'-phosphate synthase glutaminase subunit PdxT [Clostridiales bacterium]MDY2729849.1 pyridoxal 5'-phosphate synthase glutaminase subunit PdxT [Clostridium sp.]NLK24667.1 pyridoxal 5'-phosphate synthase glutaminase subunit PdxT [Clostridiales bacterium]